MNIENSLHEIFTRGKKSRLTMASSIFCFTKPMKSYLLIFIISFVLMTIGNLSAFASTDYNIGIGVLYSSEEIFTGSINTKHFSIGLFGKNWTTAEERDAGTSNYGRTKIGDFDKIIGFDFGYYYPLAKYIRIGAEVSGGTKTVYSKYSDRRFSEGYYISKEENEWIAGIGVTAALSFLEIIEIVINGNTIKGYGGGIIFRF